MNIANPNIKVIFLYNYKKQSKNIKFKHLSFLFKTAVKRSLKSKIEIENFIKLPTSYKEPYFNDLLSLYFYFILKEGIDNYKYFIRREATRISLGFKQKSLNINIPNYLFNSKKEINEKTNPTHLDLTWMDVANSKIKTTIETKPNYVYICYFYFSGVKDLELKNLNLIEKQKGYFQTSLINYISNEIRPTINKELKEIKEIINKEIKKEKQKKDNKK